MNQESRELYMPSGLRMKKEIFPGYTKDELIPTIIWGIIFVIIDCILFMCGNRSVGLLFFIPVIGVTSVAFVLIKGELNMSPIDFAKQEILFARSQKYYPYIAKQEWIKSERES